MRHARLVSVIGVVTALGFVAALYAQPGRGNPPSPGQRVFVTNSKPAEAVPTTITGSPTVGLAAGSVVGLAPGATVAVSNLPSAAGSTAIAIPSFLAVGTKIQVTLENGGNIQMPSGPTRDLTITALGSDGWVQAASTQNPSASGRTWVNLRQIVQINVQ